MKCEHRFKVEVRKMIGNVEASEHKCIAQDRLRLWATVYVH